MENFNDNHKGLKINNLYVKRYFDIDRNKELISQSRKDHILNRFPGSEIYDISDKRLKVANPCSYGNRADVEIGMYHNLHDEDGNKIDDKPIYESVDKSLLIPID